MQLVLTAPCAGSSQTSGEVLQLLCSTHAHQLLYNCTCAVHAALQQLCASPGRSIVQVKLTIQGEAYSGVMLQQTVVVDFQACASTLIVCMHRAVLGKRASFPTGKLQVYKAHRQATHRIIDTARAGGVEHVHRLQPCQHQRQHVEERCTGAALPFCVTNVTDHQYVHLRVSRDTSLHTFACTHRV